jgi:hypothetical protein
MVSSYQPLILPGQRAPNLEQIVYDFVQEVTRKDKYGLDDYANMVETCPINTASLQLIGLRVRVALGQYEHPDKTVYQMPSGPTTIQDWVRNNFETMQGSLSDAVERIAIRTCAFGFSSHEIVKTTEQPGFKGELRLKRLVPLRTRKVRFAGSKGEIDRVIYNNGIRGIPIPYQDVLHTVKQGIDDEDSSEVYGSPQSKRAYPFYKARQILLSEWVVAGQRQATGLMVIKVDSGDTTVMLDSQGKPIKENGQEVRVPAIAAVERATRDLDNRSVLVTDLKNQVQQLNGSTGDNFFNTALIYLGKMIYLSYGIPSLIFDEGTGGLGNTGLNQGHRTVLDAQIDALVENIKEQIIEKVVRPLLVWNFGVTNNFGDFKRETFIDPTVLSARAMNLISAIAQGILDSSDPEVMNRIREDLGVSSLSREDFDQRQLMKLEQQALEQEQAAAQEPAA